MKFEWFPRKDKWEGQEMWVSTSQQTHPRPYRVLCQELWETELCYHNPHLCWVPGVPECAKWLWGLPGRGDGVFGTEGFPGHMMGLARVWGHFASPSAAATQPGCWLPHRAAIGSLKLFLEGWEKHWSPPSLFH